MSWEPRPDSVAFRALGHMALLFKGSEITTSLLGEAIGVDPNTLATQLMRAVEERKIFRRQKGAHQRSPIFWSLTEHSKHAHAAPPPGPQTPMQKVQPIAATSHQLHELDIDAIHRKHDRVIDMDTPQEGANRDASAEQNHSATGSESPNGRGRNAAPALGAAPVFTPLSEPSKVALTCENKTVAGTNWASILIVSPNPTCDHGEPIEGECERCAEDLAQARASDVSLHEIITAESASSGEPKPEVVLTPSQAVDLLRESYRYEHPLTAKPADDISFGIWDSGEFHIKRSDRVDVLSRAQFLQLVAFLDKHLARWGA